MCKWRIVRKYLSPTQTLTSHDLDLHRLFLLSFAHCPLPSWAPTFCVQPGFSLLQRFLELGSWSTQPWCLPHTFLTCSSRGSSHHAALPTGLLSFLPVPVRESLTHSHYFPLTCSFLFPQTVLTSLLKKSCDETVFLSTSEPASTPCPMLPCSLSFG